MRYTPVGFLSWTNRPGGFGELPGFLLPIAGQLGDYGTASKRVPLLGDWHIAKALLAVSLKGITHSTVPLANWTDLEQRGLIAPSPGREEAVKATLEWAAKKREAERAAFLNKATPAKRSKRK